MAKKKAPAPTDEKPVKNPSTPAAKGVANRVDEKEDIKAWNPNVSQKKITAYVDRRVGEMQDFRRNLKIEGRWREADQEYVPHELDFGTTRKRFETDQDTGLRSRLVPVGDSTQQWRQASSAPTLLAKIQTAVSIIFDNMPEADLVALLKKYEKTTDLAYALWKRNWQITGAKEKLKLLIFNLIKYGWAPQRTFPRKVEYDKRVLVEVDPENPENNKYQEKQVTWFNDVDREPLNPFRTWIDELAKPYDPLSTNETYFEIDYSYDLFKTEFGVYPNFDYVPRDSYMHRDDGEAKNKVGGTISQLSTDQIKQRKDIVTVGFFESRLKDVFVIYIPKHKIPFYQSPMPNDDGYLSVTHTLYLLRSANSPYGVSLWEIIRQNKALYDKMKNMTMDQLVLSIMKFGFFSGTSTNLGDGKMEIIPGQARQLTSSTGKPEVNWMEIPGPGNDAWKGLEAVADMMDDESGISPTLEGDITGKTLGEILHAKEAALKRLKTPVNNIAWLIEQDAYVTLSWMSQVYSIPVVKEFADEQEMMAFEEEEQIQHEELFLREDVETGDQVGIQATYLPQLSLHLEDRDGKLFQSKESKFYQVGKQIKPAQMKWRGIFKVIPRSIIDSSQELVKASKMELFNMMVPILQFPPELFAKAMKQIIKVNEEDYKDWLPDSWITFLEQKLGAAPAAGATNIPPAIASIFQKMGADGGAAAGATGGGAAMPAPGGASGPTMQDQAGTAPGAGAPTVVPAGQLTPPGGQGGGAVQGAKGLFGRGL